MVKGMFDMTRLPRTLELSFEDGSVSLQYIDERLLPDELVIARTESWHEVIRALEELAIRGAPAIGVAGVAALALWSCNDGTGDFDEVCSKVAHARPTAVNLSWGVKRAQLAVEGLSGDARTAALFDLAKSMEEEDEATNRAIGQAGCELVKPGARILTHCNAGSLATVFYGTALGVVYAAAEKGLVACVYADETRPVGQGARLTTWELANAGVPVTLICDDMAASLMKRGNVDMVIVGADRIAANGDVANKIGTYGLAILAREHEIPFYVAAPLSTVDASIETGADITIEQRDPREVLPKGIEGVEVWNPAFDVTPARYVTALVTEKGVFAPHDIAAALHLA